MVLTFVSIRFPTVGLVLILGFPKVHILVLKVFSSVFGLCFCKGTFSFERVFKVLVLKFLGRVFQL